MWEVDRKTGESKVFIGPKGEMAWTNLIPGTLSYRENDTAPTQILAKDLRGINSVAFNLANGKRYTSPVFSGTVGAPYGTEAVGKLTRINLADGKRITVAEGLAIPEGVAQTPWGSFHRG